MDFLLATSRDSPYRTQIQQGCALRALFKLDKRRDEGLRWSPLFLSDLGPKSRGDEHGSQPEHPYSPEGV